MNHMSVEQYKVAVRKPKRSKYGNVKTVSADGKKFDSKREASRWAALCQMAAMGLITELERQVKYQYTIDGKLLKYRSGRVVTSYWDFRYRDGAGILVIEDSKTSGSKTPVYLLKEALMFAIHGIRVREV